MGLSSDSALCRRPQGQISNPSYACDYEMFHLVITWIPIGIHPLVLYPAVNSTDKLNKEYLQNNGEGGRKSLNTAVDIIIMVINNKHK